MKFLTIVMLFVAFAGQALGQSPAAPPKQEQPKAPAGQGGIPMMMLPRNGAAGTAVPPNTPIVTLKGVCETPQKGSACKTVVTRAEIDSMLSLLEPQATPEARRQFAINYSRLAGVYGLALQRHLEKDPAVATALELQLKLVRMQVLANLLYRQMEAKANDISQKDVQAFYKAHPATFEQYDITRITVAKTSAEGSDQASGVSALKEKMESLRARAAAGEGLELLQTEVNKELHVSGITPATKLQMIRRGNLPEQEDSVFELQPGKVTPVIETPVAFVILKLEAKRALPLESVSSEIYSVLRRERAQSIVQEVTKGSEQEFNLNFLALPSVPPLFPPPEIADLTGVTGDKANSPRKNVRRLTPPKRRTVTATPGGTD